MGPRLDRRGNLAARRDSLQDRAASMGPRLDRRGNTIAVAGLVALNSASMGPRLDRRGNQVEGGNVWLPASFNGATPG